MNKWCTVHPVWISWSGDQGGTRAHRWQNPRMSLDLYSMSAAISILRILQPPPRERISACGSPATKCVAHLIRAWPSELAGLAPSVGAPPAVGPAIKYQDNSPFGRERVTFNRPWVTREPLVSHRGRAFLCVHTSGRVWLAASAGGSDACALVHKLEVPQQLALRRCDGGRGSLASMRGVRPHLRSTSSSRSKTNGRAQCPRPVWRLEGGRGGKRTVIRGRAMQCVIEELALSEDTEHLASDRVGTAVDSHHAGRQAPSS